MRGPSAASRIFRPRPQNEADAYTFAVAAPYKGWNAIGNLATMDPLQAIQMDNIFPGVQNVQLRKGYTQWATGAPANIHSLLPWSGPTNGKMFAATNSNIYDVSSTGAIGASVATCTNGYWISLMIETAGGNFLFAVNGADSPKVFDGTTWSTPSITGVTASTWNQITLHKHRIWAVQQGSMNLYYLGTDSIAGAATAFPVGGIFKRGGYIVSIGTYTYQFFNSPDDYFVIVTSNGEIALYQGTDPSSASTWSLVGVYDVARPMSNRCLYKYGSDVLYLSQTGLLPLSKLGETAQQHQVIDKSSMISYDIEGAFQDAISSYSANPGWQIITHKAANLLLVNIPVSPDAIAYQFVMNTSTKAWCRFTGWNAACWAELNGELWFAGGTTVSKAWQGYTDAGNPITGTVLQAYSPLGRRGQKEITLVRPNFGSIGTATIQLALDNDFKTFGGQTNITYTPQNGSAIWDSSLWDSGIWDGVAVIFEPRFTTVPGNLGYLHSFRMTITSSAGLFTWTSNDYVARPAGIL